MANFAIIYNGSVSNMIVADSLADAQEAHPGVTVVEDPTTMVGIGWTYDGTVFTPPQPYLSWVLVNSVWTAPIPRPTDMGHVIWDEPTKSWIKG